jgi:hypothetical protein
VLAQDLLRCIKFEVGCDQSQGAPIIEIPSVTKSSRLNLACFHLLAVFLRQLRTYPHATFELDKKPALVASSRVLQLAGQQALLFRWY